MAKLTKRRTALIHSHRRKTDLRGSVKKPTIDVIYKVKLKNIYDIEMRSVERSINKHIVPILPELIQKQDGISEIFDRFKKAFRFAFVDHFGALLVGGEPDTLLYSKKIIKKVDTVISGANKNHKKRFNDAYKRLAGVNPVETEAGLKDQLEVASIENVQRITTLSKDYFAEIQQSVFTGLRSGTANKTVVAEIEEIIERRGDSKKINAKLIATDQIQKLNGELDKIRQKSNGGTRYIWRTRKNQRVRDDHEDLDGAVFEWGDPPITVTSGRRSDERNEPGQDINCKCRAEMVVEDILGIKNDKIKRAEEKTEKLKSQDRL